MSEEENPVAPAWLNNGDNAWQMTAATLVALQSVPGLLALYAGIVKTKWAINTAFMVFYAFAAVLVVWVTWGFNMAFGPEMIPGLVGRPQPVLGQNDLLRQAQLPSADLFMAFPLSTLCYFQFVFAAITVILMAGAFLARMNFRAWMIFVPLWITFSYCPVAYSLWGGGFFFQRGVLDYSGGFVIHVSSGTAGFVGAAWIGQRLKRDREYFPPNNILLTMVGAGILWMGWNGFNGGGPYTASPNAGAAVLNTNICTAVSLLTWTSLDLIFFGKPSIIGSVQGMITGLVGITPGAGVIPGWAAIITGLVVGSVPWVTMNIIGKRVKIFHRVDDVLGTIHTHAISGIIGGFAVGIFATEQGTASFASLSTGGAIAGRGRQVWLQIVAPLFVVDWNIVFTSLIMAFIKYVCRVPLRMSEEELIIGDDAIHGEAAYCFIDDEEASRNGGVLEGQAAASTTPSDEEAGITNSIPMSKVEHSSGEKKVT